jgi:hypothetical protein
MMHPTLENKCNRRKAAVWMWSNTRMSRINVSRCFDIGVMEEQKGINLIY